MKPQPKILNFGLRLLLVILALLSGCSTSQKPVAVFPGRQTTPMPTAPLSVAAPLLISQPMDELWVIATGDDTSGVPATTESGTGSLSAKMDEKEVPLPLKHTDVRASVYGYIGEVEVEQQFRNPYHRKIEAVYTFPLPHNAAVNEFIMTIGDRRIRGIIREREEAQKIYAAARNQGLVAALLTEERPNIFTHTVANIEPGREIDVNIKYFHTLDYVDGWYEFVFPMAVGPRDNSPNQTNGIGAVPRGASGESGQPAELEYLHPGERSRHDVSLKVDVNAGVVIEDFECPNQRVTSQTPAPGLLSVSLNSSDSLPNKDFILRYRVAGDYIKSSLLTHRDERGGFFTLMLYPPANLRLLPRQPLELVFVLDCSSSMDGRPLQQAKTAVQRALQLLQPADSFQIISFSTETSKLGDQPLAASPANIKRGLAYLNSLQSEGGTETTEGIKAALDFPHDPQRLRFVCFLTDGFVGNETEILGFIHNRLGDSRIFSFGIGSSVNRHLIDSMAKAGNGAVAYLGLNASAARVMEDFFARISHPAMTDVKLDWGGLNVTDVFPRSVPDLFVGRPVILTGRFAGNGNTTIFANGFAAGQPEQVAILADLFDPSATHKSLPNLWARAKIASLADDSTHTTNTDLPGQIRQVALDYGLMSAFTAFLAVDSTRETAGSGSATVPVAVPVPDGVKYQKTVQGE